MDKAARQRAYDKGVWSEDIALRLFKKAGCQILAQRYKTKFGEIDIIACQKDMLIFCEVKARQDYREGVEAVNYRSRRRIEQAALYYMAMNEAYADYGMRFDVVIVSGDKSGDMTVEHLDNAWMAGQ